MCIGPLAPRAPQAAAPPPPPPAPPPIPQAVVPQGRTGATDRASARRRSSLALGPGQNRTLLSGSLAPSGGQGATLLGG